MLSLAGFILALFFLHQRKQIIYTNRIYQINSAHERELLQTQLEIQEATFENVSQEIHDNIGLSLTLAKLNLNTLDANKPYEHPIMIESSKELISKAIEDLNDISKSLKAERVVTVGLLKSIEMEIDKLEKTNRYEVNLQVKGNPFFMDPEKEISLYRIFQESINNILKHASAKVIDVNILFSEHIFQMSVSDNGKGFEYTRDFHHPDLRLRAGLGNIEKRARLIFAKCEIASKIDCGTTINITLPNLP
jgi:signal transduction histidine kinase